MSLDDYQLLRILPDNHLFLKISLNNYQLLRVLPDNHHLLRISPLLLRTLPDNHQLLRILPDKHLNLFFKIGILHKYVGDVSIFRYIDIVM